MSDTRSPRFPTKVVNILSLEPELEKLSSGIRLYSWESESGVPAVTVERNRIEKFSINEIDPIFRPSVNEF